VGRGRKSSEKTTDQVNSDAGLGGNGLLASKKFSRGGSAGVTESAESAEHRFLKWGEGQKIRGLDKIYLPEVPTVTGLSRSFQKSFPKWSKAADLGGRCKNK